ncbi:MAG: sigma-54 dependent transcriptional regulator [Calditrichia bacterium]
MRILLIDDDINLCKVLSHQLKRNGYEVITANSGMEGINLFGKNQIDVVLTDIQMPDISGIEVLQELRRGNPQVVIIIMTAYGSVDNALEACRLGADDYITKPFGQEQMLFVIEKAVGIRRIQQENVQLRQELAGKYQFDNMVAHSAIMENVLQMAGRVAASDATVLILGESGTGKELMARAIHYNSPRKDRPFITVNAPSIPDNLMESELFGHVKGAYTGALKDRKGKFELADGGTIFLDEIGDLKEDVQAKLLRVLQEQEFERLGESVPVKVDVRVIAATNKNLIDMMKTGEFREDLYYRLSVVPITIPPLRDRTEDIPYLIDFFIGKHGGGRKIDVDSDVYKTLAAYPWPGNVRELENAIERAIVLSPGDRIAVENLPPHIVSTERSDQFSRGDGILSLDDAERKAILAALAETGGNQTKAARLLKIPRHVLLYRMKKLDIE